jgi:hypothetical protein
MLLCALLVIINSSIDEKNELILWKSSFIWIKILNDIVCIRIKSYFVTCFKRFQNVIVTILAFKIIANNNFNHLKQKLQNGVFFNGKILMGSKLVGKILRIYVWIWCWTKNNLLCFIVANGDVITPWQWYKLWNHAIALLIAKESNCFYSSTI